MSGCGKGSYGRLGLGDSTNQKDPRTLPVFTSRVRAVSSSIGNDGHSLAVTEGGGGDESGALFSWGDGEHGKLGHGNAMTQKVPKQVGGPLVGKSVVAVSAGYRHSAAITSDGLLYTWGEGEYGRLGTGDGQSKYTPSLVKDLADVGAVSCGCSHTLVLSKDKKTIWSFGSGEGGRLGHGDTSRQYRQAEKKLLIKDTSSIPNL